MGLLTKAIANTEFRLPLPHNRNFQMAEATSFIIPNIPLSRSLHVVPAHTVASYVTIPLCCCRSSLQTKRCTAQASLWHALEQKRPCWQPPAQRRVRRLRSCRPLISVHLYRLHNATLS